MAIIETPNSQMAGSAEIVLRAHGWTGERLLKEARKVANDYCRAHAAFLGDRFEDLVSFLVLQALRAALRYDDRPQVSYGKNGGEPFRSYLCDIMEARCVDYYRSKGEGHGDRRYGNDDRVFLAGDTLDDEPDADVDFGKLISERRLVRWQIAATRTGWSFEEFVVITLDRAAMQIERTAA